jgi:beta-xylosidase
LASSQWTDEGCIVTSRGGRDNWNAIDPNFVIDGKDNPWLVWGSFWDGIQIVRLDKTMHVAMGEKPKTIARRFNLDSKASKNALPINPNPPKNPTSDFAGPNAIEAPFIFKHAGYYYLFVSWDYCCQGSKSNYRVAVGRSKTIDGPYLDRNGIDMRYGGGNIFIEGDKKNFEAAGHCAVYNMDGEDIFICHGYSIAHEGASILIQRPISWTADGWPELAPVGPQSWTADNGNGTYTNPLFYDEFSDPDVIRVGDDYYLAGTTMHSVPGLVILHSKDLVNWENISYCFDRFDFADDAFSLKNHKEIYGQGIWAPAIRYANGQFYLFSNINGKGLQCYTSKDIHGPWKHQNMQGNIYDLSVLFDDDGKIYAIHKYGEVHCTELKPDMSGPVEGTDRVIIPEGNAIGEGHHMYKINGMYYLISTDYMPNGRTLCSRSKSIWGPYETVTITADETFGYHAAPLTQVPRGVKYRIGEDGTKFGIPQVDKDATACTNIHQGGIVEDQSGQWWALLMMDFHSIGRTVTLAPITWKDGWPMIGLEGNLGRAPRTWLKPNISKSGSATAPYNRNEDFDSKKLGRIWQWNHNPDDSKWSLKKGRLRIQSMPAEQLMWARNTLTQRVIGPTSIATVELYTKGLKDGDVAGLGNINVPCSWIGIVKDGNNLTLRCFEQATNDSINKEVKSEKIYLRMVGDFDNDRAHYEYSIDGANYQMLGREMPLSYQLITFQGSRHALFAFNHKGKQGGYAEFDNFTVDEPQADRSSNIPYGKTFRIINLATGRLAVAQRHGLLYDTDYKDNSKSTRFRIINKGKGQVILQCEDGRYVFCSGIGMAGDVRLTDDKSKAEVFMWQDYLNHEFMLMSMRTHRYIGKSPTTGSPYSMDYTGADPARRNGAVFRWEE